MRGNHARLVGQAAFSFQRVQHIARSAAGPSAGASIGKKKRRPRHWGDMAGPGNRAVGRVGGYGATKTLHIAGRDWDHDGSEKGAHGPGMRGLPIESPIPFRRCHAPYAHSWQIDDRTKKPRRGWRRGFSVVCAEGGSNAHQWCTDSATK